MCCCRAGFFKPERSDRHGDALPGKFYHLAAADFAGFAQFNLAIYLDFTFGDHGFGRTTAAAQAGDFEQIVQCNRVVSFKTEFTHSYFVSIGCRGPRLSLEPTVFCAETSNWT